MFFSFLLIFIIHLTSWVAAPLSFPIPFQIFTNLLSPLSLPFLLREGDALMHENLPWNPPWCSQTKKSSPTEARHSSPASRKGSKGLCQSQRYPLLLLLGDPHDVQTAHLLFMYRGSKSISCMLFGQWFSVCEPPWAQVCRLCRSSCSVLNTSSSQSFPHSSTRSHSSA